MKKTNQSRNKYRVRIEKWHLIAAFLIVFDCIAVNLAYLTALWVRFDGVFSGIPDNYFEAYASFAPVYTVFCIVAFWALRMYHSVWRFASFNELIRTAVGSVIASAVHAVAITFVFCRMPISYYIWGACLQLLMLVTVRFSYRLLLLEVNKIKDVYENKITGRVMVIGAGNAGQQIARSIEKDIHNTDKVVCFIDDNTLVHGRYIDGIPVVGGRYDILLNVEKLNVSKILIAIPSAPKEDIRDIINICSETDCELKNLPSLFQSINTNITVGNMADISVEDLLGRDPIRADMTEVFEMLQGKTILVTGGGGSIGSELCRQVARQKPARLIIFDIYENNAYAIEQELKNLYPELELTVLIGSVRDSRRLDQVFSKYRPDIVYHAAAHKHVPLMEDSPCEAIKNNVIGTYKTAYAAMVYNCKRFVLISTDKAVNPTNIMGASKHLCEMVITSFHNCIKDDKYGDLPKIFTHYESDLDTNYTAKLTSRPVTEFVAVRFGNVLGSNGSVVPIFMEQIKNGGPVKVTHPDIIRYFMTIPEAVSLVLTAGAYANGGEIFVLDMGSPVKIDTLARNLIRLSGFKPDIDIKIEYTGLRPGEKLYEEMLKAEEGLRKTPNELIFIGRPIPFEPDTFQRQLKELMLAAYENSDNIIKMVCDMVPTYKPSNNK